MTFPVGIGYIASMLSDLLTCYRESAGLGFSEAARLLDMSRVTLWRYEQGKRTPSYDQLRAMLEAYRCAPSECEAAEAARRQSVRL